MRLATRCAVAAAFGIALLAPAAHAQQPADTKVIRPRTTYEDLQLLSGVLNQIRVNHPDSVDTHRLLMAAIQGMVRAQDPHSYFVPVVRLNSEKEKAWRDGKLYPVGVQFGFYDGAPVVGAVVPGSKAAALDILMGDELVAIDGEPVGVESADELEVFLSGAKGTTVRLTFERQRSDGSVVQLERTVPRESLKDLTAVPAAFLADPATGTGYIRITTFANMKVAEDLHAALGALERQGMKRLVLDLRDNGGGSVAEATQIAGEFLPKDAIVYTQVGRKKDMADTGRVTRSFWKSEKRYPIVLLQNEGSASASELVAGALQDHDRALVVGRPSFGKSLVMYPFFTPDGSLYYMVAGHMRTPCGRVIQRQYRGVTGREYRRRAGVDTTGHGRPSCRTKSGRVVYGGGGVYPDVLLPRRERAPLWLARLEEDGIFFKWVGGHVSQQAAFYPTIGAVVAKPDPAPGAVADFRRYAGTQGHVVPDGADVDARLAREIVRWVVAAKFGEAGSYQLDAAIDPQVKAAMSAFDRAQAILAQAP